MRTLIFSPVFTANAPQAEVLQIWLEWQARANPDCDIVLLDNNSPDHFLTLTPALKDIAAQTLSGEVVPKLQPGLNLLRFPDTLSPQSMGRQNAFGRAFRTGVELAVKHLYDYVACVSFEILFPHPMAEIVATMQQFSLDNLAALRVFPPVMESGFCVMKTAALHHFKFLERLMLADPAVMNEVALEKLLDPFFKRWPLICDNRALLKGDAIRPLHGVAYAQNMRLYEAFMRLHTAPDWTLPSRRVA